MTFPDPSVSADAPWITLRRNRVAIAIILFSAAGVAVFFARRNTDTSPVVAIVALSHDARTIEPRISGGIGWAPYRRARGAKPSAVSRSRGEDDASPHMAGLVQLLTGGPREAVETLTRVANLSNDAASWSDLAAAFYESADRYDAPELLAGALAAADRALALDPRSVEARFNRALVLERLGLKADARHAWTDLLEIESANGWAAEARARLGALTPGRPFLQVLDAEYERIASDLNAAVDLVARDPFGARGMGILEVLGRWGEAMQAGDVQSAARHLRVARHLGAAIARHNGDRMLERAVLAIDDSPPALAVAHVAYRR